MMLLGPAKWSKDCLANDIIPKMSKDMLIHSVCQMSCRLTDIADIYSILYSHTTHGNRGKSWTWSFFVNMNHLILCVSRLCHRLVVQLVKCWWLFTSLCTLSMMRLMRLYGTCSPAVLYRYISIHFPSIIVHVIVKPVITVQC